MSNSLLMNLMIKNLLNENPRLKKNLLKEAGEYPVLTPSEQGMGLNIDDTDEIAPLPHEHKVLSPSELNKVKEPKKGGLVSALKKIGKYSAGAVITLGMLAIANFHDSKSDTTNPSDHNTNHAIQQIKKIAEEISEEDTVLADQIVRELESSPDFEEDVISTIIGHEGFNSEPYVDEHNISIGHGTGLYFGKEDNPAIIKSTWRQDLYKKFGVPEKLRKLDSSKKDGTGISRETAKFIFMKKYNQIKKELNRTAPYMHVFPEHIRKAIIDLGYNMGAGYTYKFKNFDYNMSKAGMEIEKGNLDEANNFIRSAAAELVNNFDEKGNIKGKTKYASDLPRRSAYIKELLEQGISQDFDMNISVISPPDKRFENKKYSLRNIFFS